MCQSIHFENLIRLNLELNSSQIFSYISISIRDKKLASEWLLETCRHTLFSSSPMPSIQRRKRQLSSNRTFQRRRRWGTDSPNYKIFLYFPNNLNKSRHIEIILEAAWHKSTWEIFGFNVMNALMGQFPVYYFLVQLSHSPFLPETTYFTPRYFLRLKTTFLAMEDKH